MIDTLLARLDRNLEDSYLGYFGQIKYESVTERSLMNRFGTAETEDPKKIFEWLVKADHFET